MTVNAKNELTRAMATEEGVYGVILVSGLIATSGSGGAAAWRTLVITGVTVVVFWSAHVYAGAVAAHGSRAEEGRTIGLKDAIRRAIRRSRGLFAATVIPAAVLLLGAVGIVEDNVAIWASLWVCVAVLAWLGFRAYRRKGAPWWGQILGAVSTASFGVIIIIAKAIVTH